MKFYVRASIDDNTIQDCVENTKSGILDYIESEDEYTYSEVSSEIYALIQEYFDVHELSLSDDTEDRIYDEVIQDLETTGYL